VKKLIAFDLDDTLAITKSPMSDIMAEMLQNLLEKFEVCIISGGRFEQFEMQVINRLDVNHLLLRKLHLMPTCGTRYYRYDEIEEKWQKQYAEDLSAEQKTKIISVLEEEAKKLSIWQEKTWGEIIEDRGSQVTYSALGQEAPPAEKYAWAEKNSENKKQFRDAVAFRLQDLEVRLGGSTSIDITRPGIDKAYGMQKLIDELEISKDEILFVGDKLEEGGNDYPVKAMGIKTIAVEKWEDTALVIETLIKAT
jgi:HAD superfamily hydrolase (TIGR01484 family)